MSKLQRGASCYQTGKYLGQLRVFSEIFVERDAPRRVQLSGAHRTRSSIRNHDEVQG
jgi:hypothetical protein